MTAFIPEHRTEEEREELKDQLNEGDPVVDQLRMLNEDQENLWKFKYFGERDFYMEQRGENETQMQIGCVLIENKLWPGAMNVFSVDQQRHLFIYYGFGHKSDFNPLKEKIPSKEEEPK